MKKIEQRLPVGSVVEAEVVRVTDFGVRSPKTGIEGLVHILELSDERVENPADVVKRGDAVKTMVPLDKESKKIALSMKAVGAADDMSTAGLLLRQLLVQWQTSLRAFY